MKNTIAQRIYDFLKNYPPFDMLEKDFLYSIAENVQVLYYEKDSEIFRKGEPVGDSFYIVKDGAVGIYNENRVKLIDECGEGDIFGLCALLRKDVYRLYAIAIEESIVYGISSVLLEKITMASAEANKFILTSFASNRYEPSIIDTNENLFIDNENSLDEAKSAHYSTNPVTCSTETSIKEAALIMLRKNVGSIVITENMKPLGIVTDKDLRTKIATGRFGIAENIQKIMSSPVITYTEKITVAEAQINLIKHNISHLCLTKDGTPNSRLSGIISEHDIVVIHGNNPSVLIKEVKRAKTPEALKFVRLKAQSMLSGYLEQNLPIAFTAKIISEITDSITKRAIELSLEEMDSPPPVAFSWLALGSMGRREQLLLTDQDNALVFENVPKNDYDRTKAYFLNLSGKVTEKLNEVGFEYCPAEMMASNPKWCLSVAEWKEQFDNWITNPTNEKVMLCTIFFDYNMVFGNKELVVEMTESIYKSIASHEIFLNFLGLNAIKTPPPLSFFRNFLVEAGGEHKNQFDIKARAIMPLVDAARLLILSHNLKDCNNTIFRYERLYELEPQNRDLYESCINAFKTLLRFKTLQGIRNADSGRYVDLNSLSKADRLRLKTSFRPIKDIQELLLVRFGLSHLM